MAKLGDLLVGNKAITEHQLSQALDQQNRLKGHLGTALLEMTTVPEALVLRAISVQYKLPPAPPAELEDIRPDLLRLVPPKVAIKHQAIPFRRMGRVLSVAMVNPQDEAALKDLSLLTGLQVMPHVALEVRLAMALTKYFGMEPNARMAALVEKLDKLRASTTGAIQRPSSPRAEALPAAAPGVPPPPQFKRQGLDRMEERPPGMQSGDVWRAADSPVEDASAIVTETLGAAPSFDSAPVPPVVAPRRSASSLGDDTDLKRLRSSQPSANPTPATPRSTAFGEGEATQDPLARLSSMSAPQGYPTAIPVQEPTPLRQSYPAPTSYPQAAYPPAAYPQPGYPQPGYPQPGYPQPGYQAPAAYPPPAYPPPAAYPAASYPSPAYPQAPASYPPPAAYPPPMEYSAPAAYPAPPPEPLRPPAAATPPAPPYEPPAAIDTAILDRTPRTPPAEAPPVPARAEAPTPASTPGRQLPDRLCGAETRDDVAAAILSGASQHVARAGLFVAQSERVVGWAASPGSTDTIRGFALPFAEPSVFATLRNTESVYVGPWTQQPGNVKIMDAIGSLGDGTLVVVPVTVKGKSVLFLVGETEPDDPDPESAALKRLAVMTALSLELVLLKTKIRSV